MPMGKWAGKGLLLLFVLMLGVFYGISITQEGIEQIHGPIDQQEEKREKASELPAGKEMNGQDLFRAEPVRHRPEGKTAISRIVGKAGDLLRLLADGLVRLAGKLGDAVLS